MFQTTQRMCMQAKPGMWSSPGTDRSAMQANSGEVHRDILPSTEHS